MTFNQGGGNQFLTGVFQIFLCMYFLQPASSAASSYSAHLIHFREHLIHTRLHLIHTRLHLIHTFLLFSSAEWFGTEFREFASILVPRNGSPSCFLFR
jgi:hypothetical protein